MEFVLIPVLQALPRSWRVVYLSLYGSVIELVEASVGMDENIASMVWNSSTWCKRQKTTKLNYVYNYKHPILGVVV